MTEVTVKSEVASECPDGLLVCYEAGSLDTAPLNLFSEFVTQSEEDSTNKFFGGSGKQ